MQSNEQDRALIPATVAGLIEMGWSIDIEEVRDEVYQILDTIAEKYIPLVKEYDKWMKPPSPFLRDYYWQKRNEVSDRIQLMKREIGVVTPKEIDFTPDQPLLLLWNMVSFTSVGGKYAPTTIHLGRFIRRLDEEKGDIEVDEIPLAEIPHFEARLNRPGTFDKKEGFKNFTPLGLRRGTVWGILQVIIPLKGIRTV